MMVNKADSESDIQACIAFDRTGVPWCVWHGYKADTSVLYSRWLGDHWDEERGVGADQPDVVCRLKPRMIFDMQNRPWVVWHNARTNDGRDIGCRYLEHDTWSSEIVVHRPADSTVLCFSPRIAIGGGGELWCAWEEGPLPPMVINASRWDSLAHCWTAPDLVSDSDNTVYWFCDIAVDRQGHPRVVYCSDRFHTLYYNHHDGSHWVGPSVVNDTSRTWVGMWGGTSLAIDSNDHLHVSFTGQLAHQPHQQALYTRFDGTRWSEPVVVSQDSEWYSCVAATSDSDVWVSYDKQVLPPEESRVYAVHFDGTSWSHLARLDSNPDPSYWNGNPDARGDPTGTPWVVWYGETYGVGNFDVYCSRYAATGAAERRSWGPAAREDLRIRVASPSDIPVKFMLTTMRSGPVELRVCNATGRCVWRQCEELPAGRCILEWDGCVAGGKRATSGIYLCRLRAGSSEGTARVVLVVH